MMIANNEKIKQIRRNYPNCCRVELVKMNDKYGKLNPGDKGTVIMVDDIGTIHVNWDCGSSLGVVYGEDICVKSCPKCGCSYERPPALSRRDNKTLICPDCGLREALEDSGKGNDEIETLISDIRIMESR